MTDWLLSLFFLFSLLLVLRFRRVSNAEGIPAYNQIICGLAIFTLIAIIRVYWNQGLLGSIPFISEPVFYELVIWIAVIAGTGILLSGVFNWLPVSREYRLYNKTRIQRLGLLKKVEQLVGVESRIDTLFSTTLDYMIEHYGFKDGVVLKRFSGSRALVLAASTLGQKLSLSDMQKVTFSRTGWQRYLDGTPAHAAEIINGMSGTSRQPHLVLPIHLGKRPLGLFLLWNGKETVVDRDDELTLRIAIDILARKVERDKTELQLRSLESYQAWQADLGSQLDNTHDLKSSVAVLTKAIRKVAPADFVSLTIIDEQAQNCTRVSTGENGAVLSEFRLPLPISNSLVGRLRRKSETLHMPDLDQRDRLSSEDPLSVHGLKSLVAVSCGIAGFSTIIIIGSRQTGAFRPSQVEIIGNLGSILSRLTATERSRTEILDIQRQMSRLHGLMLHVSTGPSLASACTYAARLLIDEVAADAVRISTVDDTGAFMESQALELRRSTDGMIPSNGTMVLSLMPRHEEVIRTARTIQARTGDTIGPMSEMEINQVFCRSFRTACLAPISKDNKVVGVVSVGAMSESSEFKEQDILFAASVAEIIAMAARQSPEELIPMQPALPQNTLDTRISRFLQEEQSTSS